jgi:hypothetical protein
MAAWIRIQDVYKELNWMKKRSKETDIERPKKYKKLSKWY